MDYARRHSSRIIHIRREERRKACTHIYARGNTIDPIRPITIDIARARILSIHRVFAFFFLLLPLYTYVLRISRETRLYERREKKSQRARQLIACVRCVCIYTGAQRDGADPR